MMVLDDLILYVLIIFRIMILYKQQVHLNNLKFFILFLFKLLVKLIQLKLLFFLFFQLQFQILENSINFCNLCLIENYSYFYVNFLVNLNYMFNQDFVESFYLYVILIFIFNLIVVIFIYLSKFIQFKLFLINLDFRLTILLFEVFL